MFACVGRLRVFDVRLMGRCFALCTVPTVEFIRTYIQLRMMYGLGGGGREIPHIAKVCQQSFVKCETASVCARDVRFARQLTIPRGVQMYGDL